MTLMKWNNFALIGSIGIALFCTNTTMAAEDYATWTYNADVTLNTSSTGAAVAGTVTGFPVLVRLSYKNFLFNEAKGNGADIRFAKAGLPLSYQIERWDSAAAAADIWVKLDTVKGNTAGQVIKMYWGKASAVDSSNAAVVFDTANGFAAVWHLNKSQTDATVNANAGTNNGSSDTPGIIGGASHFQADSSQYINVAYSARLDIGNLTFSAWTKSEFPGTGKGIIGSRAGGENTFDLKWMPDRIHGDIGDGVTWFNTSVDYGITPEAEKWYFVTYVMGTDGYKIYLDGDSVNAGVYVGTPRLMIAGESLRLGHTGYGDEFFGGVIDEPRIDKVMRSSDWIKLSYANQNAKQNLVTLLMTNRCIASFVPPNDTTLSEGSVLVLNPTTTCASNITWSVVSGLATTIIDPEAKPLTLKFPRVTGDTALVLHLSVTFPAGVQQKDIKIDVKESTPDPIFTFVSGLIWNGTDTMSIVPTITNLAAIKASAAPILNWVWSIPMSYADTASFDGGMLLLRNGYDGELQLNLCLDNGGTPNCKTISIAVAIPVSLALKPHGTSGLLNQPLFNIMGRRMAEQEKASRPGRPLFLRPESRRSELNNQ